MRLAWFIVLIALFVNCNAERSRFTKTYQFPENTIYPQHSKRELNTMIYTRYNVSQPNSIKRCIITTISGAYDNSAGVSSECEVHLKPEMPDGEVTDACKAYELSNDKIIILWGEAQKPQNSENQSRSVIIKTQVVDMMKNCHTVEATVRKYSVRDVTHISMFCFRPNVITFEDSYELLLLDKLDKCELEPTNCDYVIYKFDGTGRQISGPEHWRKQLSDGSCSKWESAQLQQPKQGYFIADSHKLMMATKLFSNKSNKDSKELQIWSKSFDKSLVKYRYSLVNNAIGLCEHFKNSSIICQQYDQNGQIYFETQLKLENTSSQLSLGDVYNLRDGGLLLSIWDYKEEKYLIMFDGKGNGKILEVDSNSFNPNEFYYESRIFENKGGQYCKVDSIKQKNQKSVENTTRIVVRCYTPDEFSKCVKNFCV